MVHEPEAVNGAKRRIGYDAAFRVGSVVARVLEFLLEGPDDGERQTVDHHQLSDRISTLSEDPLRQLVSEVQDAPLLSDVQGVAEASPRFRIRVTHRLVMCTRC